MFPIYFESNRVNYTVYAVRIIFTNRHFSVVPFCRNRISFVCVCTIHYIHCHKLYQQKKSKFWFFSLLVLFLFFAVYALAITGEQVVALKNSISLSRLNASTTNGLDDQRDKVNIQFWRKRKTVYCGVSLYESYPTQIACVKCIPLFPSHIIIIIIISTKNKFCPQETIEWYG